MQWNKLIYMYIITSSLVTDLARNAAVYHVISVLPLQLHRLTPLRITLDWHISFPDLKVYVASWDEHSETKCTVTHSVNPSNCFSVTFHNKIRTWSFQSNTPVVILPNKIAPQEMPYRQLLPLSLCCCHHDTWKDILPKQKVSVTKKRSFYNAVTWGLSRIYIDMFASRL